MKVLLVLMLVLFFVKDSITQELYTITGNVKNQNKESLPGATVLLLPENIGAIADKSGSFIINNIQSGRHIIKVSFVGYKTFVDTLLLLKDEHLEIKLTPALLQLQEVVVKEDVSYERKIQQSQNVELVGSEYVKQFMGSNLMQSLDRLPGISSLETGASQAKPIVRGLSYNRVVVVENNIKHEAQQWGDEHGLEIDQYAAKDIEILKGASSLQYGSDAVGGVIKVNNLSVPSSQSMGCNIDVTAKSNNRFLGSSVEIFGRRERYFAKMRATWLTSADIKVPTDSIDIYSFRTPLPNNRLRNTASAEKDMHVSLGVINDKWLHSIYAGLINNRSGFFANTHGLEPRQVDTVLHDRSIRDILMPYHDVRHLKIVQSSAYRHNLWKCEYDLAMQHNLRQEWSKYISHGFMPPQIADSSFLNSLLERLFDKYVYSANFRFSKLDKVNTYEIGLSSEYQRNKIGGYSFIIPSYKQFSTGSFVMIKHWFSENSYTESGIRYDWQVLQTEAYYDWFKSPFIISNDTIYDFAQRATMLNKRLSQISWMLGYVLNKEHWLLKINIGRSFRMPIAKELAANGVNYHRFSYEVGNPQLRPEVAYTLDMVTNIRQKTWVVELTPYVSYFSNYIYLNPSYEYDRLYGNGNQKFYYSQCRVLRYGGELHAHYMLFAWMQLGMIGEYVFAEQISGEKKGFTLPFLPPAAALFSVKTTKNSYRSLENLYAQIDYQIVSRQNHIVPPEEPTPGYKRTDVFLGASINAKKQPFIVSIQVRNLFNVKYYNHTSYYRLMKIPEAGRNFVVNVNIPIVKPLKKEAL